MKYVFLGEKQEGKKTIRVYRNEATGTELKTVLITTHDDGSKWWGFSDLYKVPMIRMSYARHIIDLYSIGLSLKDILKWCETEKALLKSEDPEKYEKLYSLILEKEKLAQFTADPIKQHLSLCTVYVLADDERIDYFNEEMAHQKLTLWSGSPDLCAFFLSWHNNHIRHYSKSLEKIFQTVSKIDRLTKGPQPSRR